MLETHGHVDLLDLRPGREKIVSRSIKKMLSWLEENEIFGGKEKIFWRRTGKVVGFGKLNLCGCFLHKKNTRKKNTQAHKIILLY
jgi:hypothetical protein